MNTHRKALLTKLTLVYTEDVLRTVTAGSSETSKESHTTKQ
jgi:hypothetical protein